MYFMNLIRFKIFAAGIIILGLVTLACAPRFLAQTRPMPTATPTKTPKPPPTATPDPALATITPIPTPLPPTPTPTITPIPATDTPEPTPSPEPTATPEAEEPAPTATPEPPTNTPPPPEPTPIPEPTDIPQPEVAYKIVHYKVLGDGENNGGIFNSGGQHLIFLTVLDENGNGLDGTVVKDANESALEVVTGSKGPGKAEISMEWDPYKLYVAADPSGPTTSEVSNAMNTAFPHIPDVVGKLGDINNEYSVCPTPEIRCTPPFYSVHFSYEITFQKQGP
jgi:hypothetical protein